MHKRHVTFVKRTMIQNSSKFEINMDKWDEWLGLKNHKEGEMVQFWWTLSPLDLFTTSVFPSHILFRPN